MCAPFGPPGQALQRMPSTPAGGAGTGGSSGYHRQHSDPCMPYLQQSFKQEFLDPLYERAAHMGTVAPQRFPPAHMMVKQEPTDYTYEPGECYHVVQHGGLDITHKTHYTLRKESLRSESLNYIYSCINHTMLRSIKMMTHLVSFFKRKDAWGNFCQHRKVIFFFFNYYYCTNSSFTHPCHFVKVSIVFVQLFCSLSFHHPSSTKLCERQQGIGISLRKWRALERLESPLECFRVLGCSSSFLFLQADELIMEKQA